MDFDKMKIETGQLYHLKPEARNFGKFRLVAGPLKGIYNQALYFIHDYHADNITWGGYVIVLDPNVKDIILHHVSQGLPFNFFEPVNINQYIYKNFSFNVKGYFQKFGQNPHELSLYNYDVIIRGDKEFELDYNVWGFENQFEPYELMQSGNENRDIDIIVNGF